MRPRTTTVLILALAAVLAAGCGAEDDREGAPIPADSAAALERQLDSIQSRFEFGGQACADITGNADPNTTAVQSIVDSLPQNVDAELRDALEQSFERLFQLTEQQCDEQKGQETEPEPPPEEPPPPETETETETTETQPPEEDGGEGEDGEGSPPEEQPGEQLPPGQDGQPPPGLGGEVPGQGGDGGAPVPGEGE